MSEPMGPELAEITASADFLRDAIIDHIDEPTKFAHDRSKTVGGSEIDTCPRKVKDSKVNDRSWGGNGYTARGKGMESALCDVFARIERRYRIVKQQDLWFTQIGDRQETLVDHDYGASATPDGFLRIDGETYYLEIKSIDPRVASKNLPKARHVAQVQYGMAICRRTGHSNPLGGLLIYQNASDWADINIFPIEPDEEAQNALLKRAKQINDAKSPMDLEPLGLAAGGAECAGCPLEATCKQERVARIAAYDDGADDRGPLPDAVIAELDDLARARTTALLEEAEAKATKERATDQIRLLLETHDASVAQTPGFKIRYSVSKGRETFDRKAAEADGLDLSPYMRQGNGFPRLTVAENE